MTRGKANIRAGGPCSVFDLALATPASGQLSGLLREEQRRQSRPGFTAASMNAATLAHH